MDGNVKEDKNKLSGVSVTVYKNDQFFARTVTENNGKFRFQLNYDTDYLLEFSKPGFVSKRVTVNTYNVQPEDQDFGHEYGGWDVSLFKAADGMDLTKFEKPFVKIAYNTELNKFEHDAEYTTLVKEEFEQLQKDFAKYKKEEDKKKKEEERLAEKARAKAAQQLKEEIKAKQISEQQASIDKSKEEKKLNKAMAVSEEEQRKNSGIAQVTIGEDAKAKASSSLKNDKEEYKKVIDQADLAFKNKEYEYSRNLFQKAQSIKPAEKYPQQKILELNAIIKTNTVSANKARRDTGEYKTKEEFLQALAKLYPPGMTEEIYYEGSVKITRRIIVDGNQGAEFKLTEHPWGGKFWFKNGISVNESVWNSETQNKKETE